MEEGKAKILIVDDDPITQALLETRAAGAGLEPHLCSDAETGWECFEQELPRLVVLDWNLPGESGVELCKKMRQSAIGKYISILIVSVRDLPEDFEVALKSGADYYMIKPLRENFFEAWLEVARKRVQSLLEMEKSDAQVQRYKLEIEEVNDQLEDSISRANQMAREAEQAYIEINQIFKAVAGGIVLIDLDCNIMRHNEFFLEMVDCTPEDITTRKCYEVFHSTLCETVNCPLQLIKNGEERVESRTIKTDKTGKVVHYSIVTTPFRGLVGELVGIVEHISDTTKRVQAEEALQESERRYRELSIVDELTGLFNKRHFNKTLGDEIKRVERNGQPLTLLMMDIDNFKHHNDTYGHADGDKVLARLGEILFECIRTNDHACRYGGEEFTIVLPSTAGEGGAILAERIREKFAAEPFYPSPDEKVQKTLSLGVTQYTPGDTIDSFIRRADANLYDAKHQGKNRYILK